MKKYKLTYHQTIDNRCLVCGKKVKFDKESCYYFSFCSYACENLGIIESITMKSN